MVTALVAAAFEEKNMYSVYSLLFVDSGFVFRTLAEETLLLGLTFDIVKYKYCDVVEYCDILCSALDRCHSIKTIAYEDKDIWYY